MNPYKCTAFISSINSANLKDNPIASDMKQWIYGCDDCQNACPFNFKVEETEEFSNLNEIKKYLISGGIIRADYKFDT